MSRSRTPRSPALPAALVLGAVTLGVVPAAASAAPASTTFPAPLPGTGSPVEVSAAHGVLAWLTVDGAVTTLHLDRGGSTSTSTVATTATTAIDRLSVGTDGSGKPVVLAIRRTAPRSSDDGRTGQDVVRIDPATGAVTPVPAAAKAGVEETAAAVEHGTLVFSRRAGDGKGHATLYRATLTGAKLTRLRSVVGLPAAAGGARSVDADEVAIAPGSTTTTGLTVAVRTVGDAEFGSQALFVVTRDGTPRPVVSWADGGAGLSRSIGGLSWETATRLWYADVDERGSDATPPYASRVVRYSTSTHRQADLTSPDTIDDLAWVDAPRGAVGVVRDSVAAGATERIGATGPLTLSPYTPPRG